MRRPGAWLAQPRDAERQKVAALGGDERSAVRRRSPTFSSLKKRAASGWLTRSATCSAVVRRMSGGLSFCRLRRICGVSPVRVSMVIGRPISSTGIAEVAARCPPPAPSAARCRGCAAPRAAACCGARFSACELDEAGQEPGECLAGARRGDEERGSSVTRLVDQLQLMGPRRPALAGEPIRERLWQRARGAVDVE